MLEGILIIGFLSFALYLFVVPLTEVEKKINIKREYEYKIGDRGKKKKKKKKGRK